MPSVSRRPGRQSAEHQAAVARRLEQLRSELDASPPLHALRVVPDPLAPRAPAPASGWAVGPAEESPDEWWSTATRIRGLAPVPAAEADPVDPAPLVSPPPVVLPAGPAGGLADRPGLAVPGRHASRRVARSWRGVVPATLRGRVAIGPAQLTVVVALLCLGLAALAFTTVRGRPHDLTPVSTPVPVDAAGSPVPASASDARAISLDGATSPSAPPASAVAAGGMSTTVPGDGSTSAGTGSVTVDVAGKVRRPGIAVLDPGARVVDALEAAGGAREGVDLTALNLARPLVDGEQILVGIAPPPGAAAAVLTSPVPGTSATTGGSDVLVDLNAAGEAELDTLPDVGPVTAQSIIAWRAEHGGFTTVDELLEVDGIGDTTLSEQPSTFAA